MRNMEHRLAVLHICERIATIAEKAKGTADKEVLHKSVSHMRASLAEGRFRVAEDLAYGILMECQGSSDDSSDEAAHENETSKAPLLSVFNAVNIGRSIKFVRVAASIRQGEMAARLGISQNYLSLLENNKSEPSLSLLKQISSEFRIPMSFLFLEGSTDYESDDPEIAPILHELKELIHKLQHSRINEGERAR